MKLIKELPSWIPPLSAVAVIAVGLYQIGPMVAAVVALVVPVYIVFALIAK